MLDTYSMAKQLNGEYKEAFEWADIYRIPLQIPKETEDEKMMELYDLLLQAENDGKPIEKIVGKDIEVFCKNFFEQDTPPSRVKVLLSRLFNVCLILFVFSIFDLCWEENITNLFPIVLGIGAGILSDALAKYLLHPIALKKKLKPIIYALTGIGIWICTVVLMLFIGEIISLELEIGSRISLVISGLYLLIYAIVTCALQYRNQGTIFGKAREEKKAIQEFNEELSNANFSGMYVKAMAKRFERIQRRKNKRGVAYTFENFTNLIRKEKKQIKWTDFGMVIFIAIIVLVPSIDIMIDETIWDGLFFMAVMAVGEFFICRFFLKSSHQSMDMQIQIIDECENRGIDILQYQEELQKRIDE